MIDFAPRELCEKLQKMGCFSESGFVWRLQEGGAIRDAAGGQMDVVPDEWELIYRYSKNPFDIPAFSQNDFTGATENADKNCQKIWPNNEEESFLPEGLSICTSVYPPHIEWDEDWKMMKCEMMECHRGREKEVWYQFLERKICK